MKLVITGTPGTGKTTVGKALAARLGVTLVEANGVARRAKCFKAGSRSEVDVMRLEKALQQELRGLRKGFVAEGHLLCEVRLACDACVVLRCNPAVLSKRLKARGYGRKKLGDNLLCEALDYCLLAAEARYPAGRVVQVDASKTTRLAGRVLAAAKLLEGDRVDWSGMVAEKRFQTLWKGL
ncbi:MAG: AAA family ATPase [Candidatus Micrarchaeota archaeon]